MRTHLKAVLALAPACLLLASACTARVLTWGAAVGEALAKNPGLVSARASWQAAEAAVGVAEGGFWPQLSLDGSLGRSGTRALGPSGSELIGTPLGLGYGLGSESETGSYQLGLSGSWNLFNWVATMGARQQAIDQAEAKRAAYLQASEGLRYSLRQAFDQVLYDQQEIALLKQIAGLLHQETGYLQLEYQSGQQPRWTYLQAQSSEAQNQWQLQQAGLNLGADAASLSALLGGAGDEGDSLEARGDLSAPGPPADLAGAMKLLEQSPDLEAQRAAARASQAAFQASLASRYPSLNATAGYQYSDGGAWPPSQNLWTVGLSASYDLFAGGGQEAAIREARLNWEAGQAALEDTLHSLQAALSQAWAGYRSATLRLPVEALAVKVGRERFETVNRLFEAGQAQYLDFEQAENNLIQSEEQQLSALLSAAQSFAGYEKALGLGLENP